MRILALDQSSKSTGWAVFENGKLIDKGLIKTNGSLIDRLIRQEKEIKEILHYFKIEKVFLEDIQLQKSVGNNVVTFKALAFTLGSLEMMLTKEHYPYRVIPPATWRKICGIAGTKRAIQKENAKAFVLEKFNEECQEDICDAICLGYSQICK